MRKNTETFEDKLKRIHELAGVKPINESKGTTSTILTNVIGSDNKNYSIVKEEGSYYIKTSINEGTLDYIGGIKNKHNYKYKYDSYAHAVRNLNYIMIDLKENCEMNNEQLNERLSKDMGNDMPPPAPGEGGEIPQSVPSPEPQAPAPQPEIPSETPAPETSPEPPVEDTPAPEANQDGLAADDSDLMGSEQGDDIDHYVGKLTAEIRNAGNDKLSEDKIKSILNSVISALPLNTVSPEDRLVIARRVKMGGKSKEDEKPIEDTPAPEPAAQDIEEFEIPMDEIISPLEKPTSQFKTPHDFNQKDDDKINEFFANIKDGDFISENEKIKYGSIILESDDKSITMINGSKKFSFNVSEATLTKFKSLIK